MRILYGPVPRGSTIQAGLETYGRELMKGIAARGHVVECLDTAPEVLAADRHVRTIGQRRRSGRATHLRRRFPHEDYRFHTALRRRALRVRARFRPDLVHALHTYPLGAIVDSPEPVIVSVYGLEVEAIPPVIGSLQIAKVVHAISGFTAEFIHTRIPDPAGGERAFAGIRAPAPRAAEWDFDLITVARLVRRKNVDTVLRALEGLGDLRYAIVGDGPELGALKELARLLGLSRVSFFGAVSEEERRALLARSRVFVMCPRQDPGDVEGLGLVHLRGVRYGLPVVAAKTRSA